MENSWREAIIRVLTESDVPLHYTEITGQILTRGYFHTDGAKPKDIVNSQITASIKHDADRSPFVRVAKGVFDLLHRSVVANPEVTESSGMQPASEQEPSDSVIRSFGMYWQRDLVIWKGDPKLFGKQQLFAMAVDFGKQVGIYILYDRHAVVYVGRAIDRPLGKRLYEHTLDRLSGRWDRFSWFGLKDVTQEGSPPRASTKSFAALAYCNPRGTLD